MSTITLPGLIDVHVHLRDPGQTEKEDFGTGSRAAIAGGFTTICDMPNNADPITSIARLRDKMTRAAASSYSDIGFHYGSLGDNLDTFTEAARSSIGLKLFLNKTTGNYTLDATKLKEIYAAWPHDSVVLLHTEEDTIDIAIASLEGLNRPVHVCHMPSRAILEKIIDAKRAGLPVTCGVTPHHFFLSEEDEQRLGVYADMRPRLKTPADREYLWEHLDDIDIFESDHAPHTHADKAAGAHGVPGLETTLPLLLTAMKDGRLTLDDIIEKCYTAPARIFDIPTDDTTSIEVDMTPWTLSEDMLQTKCGWSPWLGTEFAGRVKKVNLHGTVVYDNYAFTSAHGSGEVISRGHAV